MPSPDIDITALLLDWSNGNQAARDELMPLVYKELQKTARAYFARERSGHTLQTGALINEAYIRLVDRRNVNWENRTQFFAFAASLMRRVLIDHARKRETAKRGGEAERVPLEEALNHPERQDLDDATLLDLDEALTRLKAQDLQLARLVELRFFAGLTGKETAHALGVSRATFFREWDTAKRWLAAELE